MRIALVLTHPAPYREAVVARLKTRLGVNLHIYSLFGEDYGHSELGLGIEDKPLIQSKTQYLNGWKAIIACCKLLRIFGLFRQHDLVIWPAYAPWWLTIPILFRFFIRKKSAVCLDTTRESGGLIAKKIKGFIFRNAWFLWVPGAASKQYLQTGYSIHRDTIVEGLYLPEYTAINKEKSEADKPVFLMVANNLPYRKMHVLAAGFKQYLAKGGRGRLIFCGKRAYELAEDGIETIDGVPWVELPTLYAKADVYVHTGNEQFSTALLMGAMAGLPLMASKDVGACVDLFEDSADDEPGLLVDEWRSAAAWQVAFEQMVEKRVQWPHMGEIAKKRAAKFDVDATVTKVSELIA